MRYYAWDTETVDGHIYYSGLFNGESFTTCYGIQKDHVGWLLKQIPRTQKVSTVVFAYNLGFDLGCALYQSAKAKIPTTKGKAPVDLTWKDHGGTWEIKLDKPVVGKFTYDSGISIMFRDAMAWFPERTSLARAAEMVGSTVQKLKKPAKLGHKIYSEKFLRAYLEADCRTLYEIVKVIIGWHEEYDIPLSVSSPHMSSIIFRTHFMDVNLKPSSRAMHGHILRTYHGGKLYAEPGEYQHAKLVDVKSAYPFAMLDLPKMCCGRYVCTREYSGRHGVYKIWGKYQACKWGLFYPPFSNKALPSGELEGLWVTGHELEEALRWEHFVPKDIRGYIWEQDSCDHRHAFRDFVREFYRKRQEARSKSGSLFAKLMMNSFYGKLGQRNKDEEGNKTIPGPCFEPFLYTLITAHTRAYMHYWEHELDSKHTATDSIITTKRVPQWILGSNLGYLGIEVEGKAIVLRNKCYAFFNARGKITKAAQHGYQGEITDLIHKAQKGGNIKYVRKGLLTWKTAWRKELQPGSNVSRNMMFKQGVQNVSKKVKKGSRRNTSGKA